MPDFAVAVARAHEQEWGRVVSTLIRVTGDWTLAEDCAQEAFESALQRWPRDGVPDNPGAWLTTVARNRAVDRLRRAKVEREKVAEMMTDLTVNGIGDDRLQLIFTCCHPALAMPSRVALTLRTVAGLTTAEIARMFLVAEATMAQRLVRAKAKIVNSGIPYRVPPPELLDERLHGVLTVLYLLFTEGYSASEGDSLVRVDLADEAIRLGRMLVDLMPTESEAGGLLALMLLQHSRRFARTDAGGELVPLEEQDRGLWRADEIAEGVRILRSARADGRYRLQAVIAATHATAPSFEQTDFTAILRAYDTLATLDPSPVVALNRALAAGMALGPEIGLVEVAAVAGQLPGYYLVPAARADLLRRLERYEEAAEQYRVAIELAPTTPERRYLQRRLAECQLDGNGAHE